MGDNARWAPGPSARVDWSHPFAQGLIGLSLGQVILVGYTGLASGPLGGFGVTTFGPGPRGNNAVSPNGTKLCDWPAQTDTSEFTLTFVGTPGATSDPIVGYRNGGGPSTTFAKIYGSAVQYYSNGSEMLTVGHGLASTTSGVLHFIKRGLTLEVWRDGIRVNATSFSAGQLNQNAAVCYWMQGDEGGGDATATTSVLSSMHSRALQPAEITDDPFSMLMED